MQKHNQKSNITLQSIQNTFDAIAAEFDITRYKPWPQTVEFINELPENGLIVDMGCGNGRNTLYLASVHRGFRILGLDFSMSMLRIAKSKIKRPGFKDINIEFLLGDIVKLPLTTSSLDGALFVAALHHLPSVKLRLDSLKELERCLKPGGKAFISVWDFEQERFREELARQLKDPPVNHEFGDVYVPWTGKRGATKLRFYHLFYRDEFQKLLGQTSLEIIEIFRASDNYHGVVEKKKRY